MRTKPTSEKQLAANGRNAKKGGSEADRKTVSHIVVGVAEDDPDPDHDPAMQLAHSRARTFINHANKFGLLSIYKQRINRAVHKNRAELRPMQMEPGQARQAQLQRMAAEGVQAEKEPQTPTASALIPINSLRPQASPNGFVCANDVSIYPARGLSFEKAA
jgi:hypothetical protein